MGIQIATGKAVDVGSGAEEFLDTPIMAEINITPLTDVFLVLLIIFMVTSSVMSQMGVQVQLPKSTRAATVAEAGGVLVSVTSEGEIYINGSPVKQASIGQALRSALAKTTDKTVILEGDRRALLGTIVQIMDEAKKAGAAKFAVATSGGKE